MIGLCTNARTSWPSTADINALGLRGGWLRSIVYSFNEFDAAMQSVPADVKVCALLRKECQEVGGNYERWDPAILEFSRRFQGRVFAVECDNEADLNGDPPSHSVNLVRRAKPVLNAHGMKAILTSVAGPQWQDYLVECRRLLGDDGADYGALHPYGSRAGNYPSPTWGFGEISAQVRRAHELLGLPIAVTECGIKVRDAGGEPQQATWIVRANDVLQGLPADVMPFATLFCLGDKMGSPGEQGLDGFGLLRQDGSRRPAWQSFANVNGGPTNHPPANQHAAFVLGFEKWHNLEPALIGDAVKNERNVAPGWQIQPTSRGVLSWVSGPGHAFVQHDGRVFRWQEDWPASQEVPT